MHVVFSKNICFRLTWLIRRRVGDLRVCFRIFSFSLTQLRICLRSMLKFLDIRLTHSLLFQSTYQNKKSFALLCKIDAFWKILDLQLLCFNWWFKHLRENIRKKHSKEAFKSYLSRLGKMAQMCVAKIKSRIKDHHWDKCKYTIGEKLRCITETRNKHGNHVVSVNTK